MPDLILPYEFDNDPPDTNVIDADEMNANFAAIQALLNGLLADDNFADSVKRQVAVKQRATDYANKVGAGVGDGTSNYGDVLTQMQDLSPSITCRGNPFLVIARFYSVTLFGPPEYKVFGAAAVDGVAGAFGEQILASRSLDANFLHASLMGIVTPSVGVHRVGVALRTDITSAGASVVYGPSQALILELNRATLL